MQILLIYGAVLVAGAILVGIARLINRDMKSFAKFTLMEIVIMAILGVLNGVLGTPNAMFGRFLMTFTGSYGFLAFSAITGFFYIAGPLAGYIIRKPGAATIAETINGVAQVLSGNPNGAAVLGAGFLQGLMSDIGFSFFGYRRWGLVPIMVSGALAPLLQEAPEVYFFGVGNMGWGYNLLAILIRMISGALYAALLVIPIGKGLAKSGVFKGTALEADVLNAQTSTERIPS